LLKVCFILMSPFNMQYTLLVAFASSFIGVLRVFKAPQMSKEYLQRVLMNNHGQNLMYITFGMAGRVNYLYYAPIALFFTYGVAEYVKIKYPQIQYINYVELVRNNKAKIFETKGILEIIYLVYVVATVFFDLFGGIVKIVLMGQMLLMKYKISPEFRGSCQAVNRWILEKTAGIELLRSNYLKLSGMVYGYAARGMQ
jgi:hypothetical protein